MWNDDYLSEEIEGSHNDRYDVWRQTDSLGNVLLGFAVITQAISDLFYGTVDEMLDAAAFFLDKPYEVNDGEVIENSTIGLWLDILGVKEIPQIVSDYLIRGKVPSSEEIDIYIATINNLYANVKVDFLYIESGGRAKKSVENNNQKG